MNSAGGTPTPDGTSTPVFSAPELLAGITESLIDPVERASLIYRVRDEIMSTTGEGQQLTDLYYQHSLEIATLMLADTDLYDQGFEALDAFLPGLQALVDGNGETVTITAGQVSAAQAFLDELSASGSPELQQAIQDERDRYPLENLIGVTMDQAWTYLNGFPSTSVLDNFNRANGSIGSNWSGFKTKYEISSNQLRVKNSSADTDIYWSASPFGADQEAYVTFSDVHSSADEQDLLLKAQSASTWGNGVLEVWYDAPHQRAQVWTYKWPQGWVQRGADIPVTFVDGDTFGARARPDGMVEVYRNGELLATRDISAWPHYDDGGYIGLWFVNAYNARLDDFGGGTVPGGESLMMSMDGPGAEIEAGQLNVELQDANVFWQGLPVGSGQEASVTFATVQTDTKGARLRPQSNGIWGEGVVEVLYDVTGQRIQVWMYEPDKGWVQFGKDIAVKFVDGDRFSALVRPDGVLEIYRNGKLLAERKVDSVTSK
jgi:hypothetical protein